MAGCHEMKSVILKMIHAHVPIPNKYPIAEADADLLRSEKPKGKDWNLL